jgi:hypothetical protein
MRRKITLLALCVGVFVLASGLLDSPNAVPANAAEQSPAGAWQLVPSPGGATLYAVAPLSSNDVWAVGSGGRIQHWNGTAWTIVPSPVTGSIVSIAPVTPGDIWAAVYEPGAGAILHWDGAAWTAAAIPTNLAISGVSAGAPGDAWAIGGQAQPVLLHWDGKAWRALTPPTGEPLARVSAVSATDAWLVSTAVTPGGGAHFWHWDGRAWTNVYGSRYNISTLRMNAANDGWAALGTCFSGGSCQGEIVHWNGASWQTVLWDDRRMMQTVDGAAPAGAWASDGTDMLRWNGASWTQVGSPLAGVLAVDWLSPNDGWAVGYGTMRYTAAPARVPLTQAESRANPGGIPVTHWLMVALAAGWIIGRIWRGA